jgi:arsenate reductase (thioredoxin)
MRKKRVLFICTHNASRSQMAEAFLRALRGEAYEAFSAGTEPGILNPYVVKAMAEVGIDISGQKTKRISDVMDREFDLVLTLCNQARGSCPYIPGEHEILHKGFDDPSALTGSDEEIMAGIRRIRDEIRNWIETEF